AVGMVGGQTLDLIAEGKILASGGQLTPSPLEGEGGPRSGRVRGIGHTDPEAFPSPGGLRPPPSPSRGEGDEPLARLEDLHARKTGALFRSSLRLGVHAAQAERPAGANPEALAAADEYAAAFGLLFQVTDDLLDVESTAERAGKRVGKDAARGKLTYPGLL